MPEHDGTEYRALEIAAPAGIAALDPALLAGQLASSSIAQYRRDMAPYGAWCAAHDASPLDAVTLARYRAALAGDTALSPATINRRIAAIKRLVKEGAIQGHISADVAAQFAGVVGVKASALRDRQRAGA